MKYSITLIAVSDMTVSRRFYEDVLKQTVTLDLGENLTFGNAFSLQANYAALVDENLVVSNKANDHELYFEEENFPHFIKHLKIFDHITYLHDPKEYP